MNKLIITLALLTIFAIAKSSACIGNYKEVRTENDFITLMNSFSVLSVTVIKIAAQRSVLTISKSVCLKYHQRTTKLNR